MSLKIQNSLILDYPLDGLPEDWRKRVEGVVLSVGATYDLYVTRAQAGARRSPPGVLVSIAREGAESAWNDTVAQVMAARIRATLDGSKEHEKDRREERRHLERAALRGFSGLDGEVSAVEDPRGRTPTQLAGLRARRRVLTTELRSLLARAPLPAEARAVADAALAGMADPAQWALWAQLLPSVAELREALGSSLRERLEELL